MIEIPESMFKIFRFQTKTGFVSKTGCIYYKCYRRENGFEVALLRRNSFSFLLVLAINLTIITIPCFSAEPQCCQCQNEPVLSRTGKFQDRELLYELQQYWKELSLYNAKPNGRFDRTMEEAVINFQKQHHLKTTGVIDQETWEAIGSLGTDEVSTGKLPAGRVEVLVELNSLTLTILVDRKPFRSFPVAIGKLETPSPVGAWKVVSRGYWAKGKTKWLGLSVPYGVYGIHGTNKPWSIGRRASNGCIRMFNHHIETVYQWIKQGTPVYIDGNPFRDYRVLKRGLSGSDVYYLQIRLKQLNYYTQKPNGVFDYWTKTAVEKCQEDLGLPVTGEITSKEYFRLKLYPTD